MATVMELTIPIHSTVEMWNKKYPTEFSDLFGICENEGILNVVLPSEITNKKEFMYNYLLSSYSYRIIKPKMLFDSVKDSYAIAKMKSEIYYIARTLLHKFQVMNQLLYTNWDITKIDRLTNNYDITKTGSINDIGNMSLNGGSTTKTNDAKTTSKIYTFDNQLVTDEERETDYTAGSTPSSDITTTVINNSHGSNGNTRTFNSVREYGTKGESFVQEFKLFYDFINHDIVAEFIKDVSPAFLLQVWC